MTTPPEHREPCALPSVDSTKSFWHTKVSPLLKGHRSTRELPSRADIVIVGSGITGASVAHHLFEGFALRGNDNGSSIVMLEAREACWGATGRNGGHCQPMLLEHTHDPSIGQFELDNFFDLRALINSQNIDCEFVAQPGVRGIYSADKLRETELAILTLNEKSPELSHNVRLVTSRDELARLRVPTALGAIVTAIAARMWPYKFVSHILEKLLTDPNLRGRFNLQTLTPVENIAPTKAGRWNVKTSRGIIGAGKVVLATNAYTSHLLPAFSDLIVPCRGQMSALLPSPSVADANRLQTSLGFEGEGLDDYLIQRPNESGGQLMFGGGRQESPSLGISDDSVIDEKSAKYLRTRLPEALRLNDVGGEKKHRELQATHQWTGIMGFSRDDLPWVGRVPDSDGLYIAAGFTGHGMPNTWLSGKAVAVMIARDLLGHDQDHSVLSARVATGLPQSYVPTQQRIARAMRMDHVEVREQRELARRTARAREDRPPSGYA